MALSTEYIERILAYLVQPADTREEHGRQLQILSTFNQVTNDALFSTEYLLYKMVNNLFKIKVSLGYTTVGLNQEDILRQMESEIKTLVFSPEFNLEKAIFDAELPLDRNNPSDMNEILNTFYMRFSDSIENIFSVEMTGVQAMLELNALKEHYIDELYREKLLKCSKMYNEAGVKESLELSSEYDAKLARLQACNTTGEVITSEDFIINNYTDYLKVEQLNSVEVKELYAMGFAPLDVKFKIRSNDIVVIVAEVNAGKTRIIEDQLYKAYTSGNNVAIIPTETEKELMLPRLFVMHMFYLFGITAIPLNPEQLNLGSEEQNQRVFDDLMQKYDFAKRDFWDNPKHGQFHFISNITYESCSQVFYNEKVVNGTDIIFIDHTRALMSDGSKVKGARLTSQKEQLAYLATTMREIKTSLGIAFVVTSHPSSDTSRGMTANKVMGNTNITAGATEISEIATRMFYLTKVLESDTLDVVTLHESKTRTEGILRTPMLLQRLGMSNVHIYDESRQVEDNSTDSIGDLIDE